MDETPTVLVLGRRTTDNMPSLTRMKEILKPLTSPGMDATVNSSVRITGRTQPRMGGGNTWCPDCGGPLGPHDCKPKR